MSDFFDILRSAKRGPSPSRQEATSSFRAPQKEVLWWLDPHRVLLRLMLPQGMRSPYPTTPSKPWVPGSSLAKRASGDTKGPQSGPYSASTSAPISSSSFSKVHGNPSTHRLFSSPEPPPFQIPEVVVISSTDNIYKSTITNTENYTNSGAESTGLATSTCSYRRRPFSLRSKPLPPTPDGTQLQIPPFAHIGTRRNPSSSSSRPRTAPTPHTRHNVYPESYGNTHYTSSQRFNPGLSSEPLAPARDRLWDPSLGAQRMSPSTPPTRRPLAQKEEFRYGTPPPSYQTLDAVDNGLVFPSHDPKGSAHQDMKKHRYVRMPNS
jgi:hypothetical protein